MGVAPTSDDIEKEIKFRTKRNPQYIQILTAQGITLELIRRDVELELARENVITHGITVTPAEVDDYIKKNKDKFQTPATVNALFVVVSDPAKQKLVDQELSTGQNFLVVAQRYSIIDARKTGARWPRTVLSQNPPDIRQALEATTEGKTTGWIREGNQIAKFYVEGKTAAKDMVIDDTLKELVRRQVSVTKGSQAMDLQARVSAELKKAKIDVNIEPLKNSWKAVMDQLSGAQGAQPSAGTPGATAQPNTPTGAASQPPKKP
jgi:parvulin-like peptidyl-prolyl isomerase